MRRVCGLVLVLSAAGWFACSVELPNANSSSAAASGWRRTVDGWEPTHAWTRGVSVDRLPLHPGLFASAELLFCLLALSALPSAAVVGPSRVR